MLFISLPVYGDLLLQPEWAKIYSEYYSSINKENIKVFSTFAKMVSVSNVILFHMQVIHIIIRVPLRYQT